MNVGTDYQKALEEARLAAEAARAKAQAAKAAVEKETAEAEAAKTSVDTANANVATQQSAAKSPDITIFSSLFFSLLYFKILNLAFATPPAACAAVTSLNVIVHDVPEKTGGFDNVGACSPSATWK